MNQKLEKIDSYAISRYHSVERFNHDVLIHYMHYRVSGPDVDYYLDIPCRSNIHKILTSLFWNNNWNNEDKQSLTKDEAYALKHMFLNRKDYNLWKKIKETLYEKGIEEGKKFMINQVKVLTLGKILNEGHFSF